MPMVHHEQNTPEWLDARRGKITASIAAACLGLDPSKSRQFAWRTVLGIQKEYAENKHQAWGHNHEQDAAADYEALTGNVLHTTGFWVHPDFNWLGASPDRFINPDGIWEGKCLQILPDKLPIHTRIQMIIEMVCSERVWGDYFVWHSFNSYYSERIELVQTEAADIIANLSAFRDKYILTNIEPERKQRAKKDPAPKKPRKLSKYAQALADEERQMKEDQGENE